MKKGISLIVLVITIIVMMILAASVVITLNNTGIINNANHAVKISSEKEVQEFAEIIWTNKYIEGLRGKELEKKVEEELSEQGIDSTEWNVVVSDAGVKTLNKSYGVSLGELITTENYGDTIDYEVTVGGTKYSDWKIFYEDEENGYVFLIKDNALPEITLAEQVDVDVNLTWDSLSNKQKTLYSIFKLGEEGYLLNDEDPNSRVVVGLIKDYENFANTKDFGVYVVGAIGGPTIQLLQAAWNSSPENVKITTSLGTSWSYYGYSLTEHVFKYLTPDDFYIPINYWYFLTSPSAGGDTRIMVAGNGSNLVAEHGVYGHYKGCIRPVVCLKSNTVAKPGTITDISIVK